MRHYHHRNKFYRNYSLITLFGEDSFVSLEARIIKLDSNYCNKIRFVKGDLTIYDIIYEIFEATVR